MSRDLAPSAERTDDTCRFRGAICQGPRTLQSQRFLRRL